MTPTEAGLKLSKAKEEKQVNATLFKQIVGSLRFLCNNKPNICYVVGIISRFKESPRVSHMLAAKHVLRYVKGTTNFGVLYPNETRCVDVDMIGFTDSDWKKDPDEKKNTASYVFMYCRAPISWSSRKQDIVALSTCEAEYVAGALGACQAVWLKSLLEELQLRENKPVKIMMDNQLAINLAKHPVAHCRTKHIETRFHFLCDQVSKGKVDVEFCRSEDQVVDVMTKTLRHERFKEFRKLLGMQTLEDLN